MFNFSITCTHCNAHSVEDHDASKTVINKPFRMRCMNRLSSQYGWTFYEKIAMGGGVLTIKAYCNDCSGVGVGLHTNLIKTMPYEK